MRDWTLQKPNGSLESSQAKQGHEEGVRQYVIPGPALRKNPPITDERGTVTAYTKGSRFRLLDCSWVGIISNLTPASFLLGLANPSAQRADKRSHLA
jgi:hypothetical protein